MQPSTASEPWCFYAHLHKPIKAEETDQGQGPAALHLPDVLAQVFGFVDSSTLRATAPVVCKQWHHAAQCPLLWMPRLDPQLLAVAAQQQQHKHQQAPSLTSAGMAPANVSQAAFNIAQASCPTSNTGLSLALLQHAVYGCNLLRNPCFLSSRNACRRRSGSGGSSISSSAGIVYKTRAVLSPEQRLAWVRGTYKLSG
ncbi:hypothetical protein COO60DRAFT_413862 [Scenedesmus sp. NREL 46B-D3]|nr:hypothetical protein COO60DRAFT_413862 [Scenedesmus sp. NREL 46B-D3]